MGIKIPLYVHTHDCEKSEKIKSQPKADYKILKVPNLNFK
jgi:hypothetical protein